VNGFLKDFFVRGHFRLTENNILCVDQLKRSVTKMVTVIFFINAWILPTLHYKFGATESHIDD
jgi:hypothetical protein